MIKEEDNAEVIILQVHVIKYTCIFFGSMLEIPKIARIVFIDDGAGLIFTR